MNLKVRFPPPSKHVKSRRQKVSITSIFLAKLMITGEPYLSPALPVLEPFVRNDEVWRRLAIRIRQRRRSRSHPGAHRVKRSKPDKFPAKIASTQASYAVNTSVTPAASGEPSASAASSSSAGPSTAVGSSAGTEQSAGARLSNNTEMPSCVEKFASDGTPDITQSSSNSDAPGVGDDHHPKTDGSEDTSGPRMGSSQTLKEYSHLCWICRQPFQISTGIKDNWKCYHQPPSVGKNGDLLPAQLCESGHNPSMHVCCWDIAQSLLHELILTGSNLIKLLTHLQFLSPFATQTPSSTETNSIDLELFTDHDFMPVVQDKDCRRQLIPEGVLSQVSMMLDQKQGSLTVDELREIDPCLAYWMTLSHPYSLGMNSNQNIAPSLKRVMHNLRESDASRFPKAYNFWVAWHNIQEATRAARSLHGVKILPLDGQLKGLGKFIRYCIPAEHCRRLTFFFGPCGRFQLYRLIGLACDGKPLGICPLGMPHVRSINLEVRALRGLHFAQTNSGQITAFKVKNGDAWSENWFGVPQNSCDESQLHWIETKQDLIVHFDVS